MNGKQLDPCAGCEPQLVSEATGFGDEQAPADPAKAGYRNTSNLLKMLLEHGTPREKMPGGVPHRVRTRWVVENGPTPKGAASLPDPQRLGCH